MTTSEKVAYLKGLAEGLAIDAESKEGKLFAAIIDILEDVASDIEDLEDNADETWEEIDRLDEDIDDLTDFICDDEDEDDGCDDDCGDDCCCCGDDSPVFYEITCPSCEKSITIDEDVFDLGAIQCPGCGEILEFDDDSIEGDSDSEDQEAE